MYFLFGKYVPTQKKIDLFVDGWKMHEVPNYHTGKQEVKESYWNEHEILESKQEKYLGQISALMEHILKILYLEQEKG